MDLATLDLDESMADGLIDTPELWETLTSRLSADETFREKVLRLAGEPEPDDLFGAPLWMPQRWLEPIENSEELLPAGTKLQVTAAGQAYGRFFEWDECLLEGKDGECWTPPSSPSGYEPFHQNDAQVLTADNERALMPAGLIGVGGHHTKTQTVQEAIDLYQHADRGKMIGRAYEDEIGGYVAGGVVASATFGDVALLRAAALSGHWMWRDRFAAVDGREVQGYDCLGPCLVARPGLPLRRQTYVMGGSVVASAGGKRPLPLHVFASVQVDEEAVVEDAVETVDSKTDEGTIADVVELNGRTYALVEETEDATTTSGKINKGGCSGSCDGECSGSCGEETPAAKAAAVTVGDYQALRTRVKFLEQLVIDHEFERVPEGKVAAVETRTDFEQAAERVLKDELDGNLYVTNSGRTEDYVIFRRYTDGDGDGVHGLFSAELTIGEDDTVTLGSITEVREVTSYEPV